MDSFVTFSASKTFLTFLCIMAKNIFLKLCSEMFHFSQVLQFHKNVPRDIFNVSASSFQALKTDNGP